MSCFWDSIINKLTKHELSLLGVNKRPTPSLLCKICGNKNKIIGDNVLWQGENLNEKEKREHFISIKECKCLVNRGHLTSSCDSVLLLLCDICKINIIHKGVYGTSNYTNTLAKKTIILRSNTYHMW